MALEARLHRLVESGPPLLVEGLPEREGGPEVLAEDLPHLAAVLAFVPGVELLERELERVAEHLLDVGLVSPLERRSGAGRRGRHERRHRGEHLADAAVAPPGSQADPAARPADRASSVATRSWSGAKMTPTEDETTSNDASG